MNKILMPAAFKLLLAILAIGSAEVMPAKAGGEPIFSVQGELKVWHALSLTFSGPEAAESDPVNPFLDYRLDVTFRQADKTFVVPGYFAADGRAAESGAAAGNKWRVHFIPDAPGEWSFTASFRKGPDAAIRGRLSGEPCYFDGVTGRLNIIPSDKTGRDFRGRGLLRHKAGHYLRFAGTGEYFLKAGADSPETFLAFKDFDNTVAGKAILHEYGPHLGDWKEGDPTWKGGRGKGIIGALNYLAGKGANSVYFMVMNAGGDGDNVWPWPSPDDRLRYDCSKLDQWEVVFSHMDRVGIMLHVVTQETENDGLLDHGELGRERRLYYRELAARFGHHLALTWNLGEENNASLKNDTRDRKAFAAYLRELDPYDHPIVVHNYPVGKHFLFTPLLGDANFDGPSLQLNRDGSNAHSQTIKWVDRSESAGHPWVVCVDEFGEGLGGVSPDSEDAEHDTERDILYANLMAQGGGVEWYFRWTQSKENDLTCENLRSRDQVWDLTRYALEFFQQNLPFWEMGHTDELLDNKSAYVLAKPGEIYAIYFRKNSGGRGQLEISSNKHGDQFEVSWFNPRDGQLQGTSIIMAGNAAILIGPPPRNPELDWVALVKKVK